MTHQHARYTWLDRDDAPPRRVDRLYFRRRFTLDQSATDATLRLFASTRYRLRVNGRIIGSGPARFVPGHEAFDTVDLQQFLRFGENELLVEACFIGANNYQSMPGDRGRFIAWGEVETGAAGAVDLSTPGAWEARRSGSRDDDAPAFSFAIGPAEVLDGAALRDEFGDAARWRTPDVLDAPVELAPRDLATPSGGCLTPTPRWAAPLIGDEARFGFVSVRRSPADAPAEPREERYRYATFLHSPRQQAVTLGLHWGPHWLNGKEVAGANDPVRGNRQNAEVSLKRGWNLLCGEVAQLQPAYPFLLGASPGLGGHRPRHAEP